MLMKKIFTLIAMTFCTLAGMADTEVTTTAEITDGTYYYAMFSAQEALDFTAAEGVEVFAAKSVYADRELPNGRIIQELKSIALVPVKQAPASTGLVVRSATADTFTIPAATGDVAAIEGNELVAVSELTDAFNIADMDEEVVPFVIGFKNATFGIIPVADYNDFEESDGWMPEETFFLEPGTSYLNLDYSLATPTTIITVTFESGDDTTGIKSTLNSQFSTVNYYDLQGRRVAQPQKGLYIVDGRKVILK